MSGKTKEQWKKEFELREILGLFCEFAQDEGYLDSDWNCEFPYLIDRYIEYLDKLEKSNEKTR